MDTMYTVRLTDIINEFQLEVLYAPDDISDSVIVADDVNRPGLQLSGFYDYFDASRVQILGKVENTYLDRFTPEAREQVFDKLFAKKVPALIISRGLEPFDECIDMAKKHAVPVLRSIMPTSYFMSALVSFLKESLAPRITRHGVMVEVYGEGILLFGESGIGKSETAIELVKRGHRLVADDAVELKKISSQTLLASAPDMIRHYIELRGIGIVDIRRLFGMGAVRLNQQVDMVINLEPWQDDTLYDRMGLEVNYTTILDVKIPLVTVPIKPGRNLAIIIEVAAMNNRDKKMGYNAAQEFTDRMNRIMLDSMNNKG